MASFANPSGSFLSVGGDPVQVFVPATGNTIQLRRGSGFYMNHAATIAALAINLPVGERGLEVTIGFKSAVTALGIRDRAGTPVPGAGVAATAGSAVTFCYVNKTVGWVPWV